jgi:hypothetical protein
VVVATGLDLVRLWAFVKNGDAARLIADMRDFSLEGS